MGHDDDDDDDGEGKNVNFLCYFSKLISFCLSEERKCYILKCRALILKYRKIVVVIVVVYNEQRTTTWWLSSSKFNSRNERVFFHSLTDHCRRRRPQPKCFNNNLRERERESQFNGVRIKIGY